MAPISAYLILGTVSGAILLSGGFTTPLRAQSPTVDDLKTKIAGAQLVQQAFAKAMQHCNELNGESFYLKQRDRVLNLTDYHRSLDSLVLQRAFNPDTNKPWSQQDAAARWAEVQKQAAQDKDNCAQVASLPFLQKKLQELQQQANK